eukprot:TRINITY_DN48918_c0_g1_i1.p1 TRINITY_DN48918_c0_g1~~TRINITY_DN48918_c0_g1_i1.p1  ORF type:complete len:455 (-),score=63.38 TRINITY_DN48918_c0_g1_i1:68-1432(-)
MQYGWQPAAVHGWPQAQMQPPGFLWDQPQDMQRPATSWSEMANGFQEPSLEAEAVDAFMQQLDIDPREEDLRWIAELGLQTPLPPSWSCCADPNTGFIYYVHNDTHETSWDNPLVPGLKRIVAIGRSYIDNPTEGFLDEQNDLLWQEAKDALDQWHGPFKDVSGRTYFVNQIRGTAASYDPRVDSQYIFDLQSSFLKTLEEALAEAPQFGPGHGTDDSPELTTHHGDVQVTDSGAEVLTLEQSTPRKLTRFMAWQQGKQVDYKSTLQHMSKACQWLAEISQDESDAQCERFSLKVRARTRRNPCGIADDALKETMAPQSLADLPLGGSADEKIGAPLPCMSPTRRGRPIPSVLELDDEPREAHMPIAPPMQGSPSAANRIPLLSPAIGGQDRLTPFPASPSLQRKQPGRQWASEAFLASKLAQVETARPTPLHPMITETDSVPPIVRSLSDTLE